MSSTAMASKPIELYPHNLPVYQTMELVLEAENKVNITTGTGGGKTPSALKYMQEHIDPNKTLIVSPRLDINAQWISWLQKYNLRAQIRTLSHMTRYVGSPDALKESFGDLDLIITDEAHKLGAPTYSQVVETLEIAYPNAKWIGATATDVRMDGENVTVKFFNNQRVGMSRKALCDAGVMSPYIYLRGLMDTESYLEEFQKRVEATMTGLGITLRDEAMYLKTNTDWSSAIGVPKIIKKGISAYKGNKDNMKFIVFLPTIDSIGKNIVTVMNWFKTACPRKKVVGVEYHSKSCGKSTLSEFKSYHKNTIDLIFTVDKLGEGFHDTALSGVMLLRGTRSHIVYTQQIGRPNVAGSNISPIVFDIVNNVKSLMTDKTHWYPVRDTSSAPNHEVQDFVKRALDMGDPRGLLRNMEATDWEGMGFTLHADEVKDFTEALIKIMERLERIVDPYLGNTSAAWSECAVELYHHIESTGALPTVHTHNRLADWLIEQLVEYKKGKLADWKAVSLSEYVNLATGELIEQAK